ncbi:nucleotidyltransferase family protein [Undibacterium flavidum]|uniref:Nucleotidyltransferase family protein n=1 Tax=Undibacterium flavidum TaxID=2762297 RepID=A0ABR6Y9N7_9BURK|nr:nucleotidyltransferase family protein [Undibacterium flavidum]MBC3873301.1 nucleotidyltransferase family protein [Undibacterium flavidum]
MPKPFLCYGILLAAGQGKRFDASGLRHKLLQQLPDGRNIVTTSATNLQQVLPHTIAVVARDADSVQDSLKMLDIPVVVCEDAPWGMSNSLRTGLQHLPIEADAFIIVLADMPFIRVETIQAIASSLAEGAQIVVPTFAGQRGNPVGFAKKYSQELSQLEGDRGARQLLQSLPVTELIVDDPGILRDIDLPEDLH